MCAFGHLEKMQIDINWSTQNDKILTSNVPETEELVTRLA